MFINEWIFKSIFKVIIVFKIILNNNTIIIIVVLKIITPQTQKTT